MANIFNLPEATGVSDNDYIYISGVTNGDRKIKAEKLVGGDPVLITKTITENGIYNASSDNAEGYSSVTVDIFGGVETVTQSVYDALSQAEKMNGTAYLIQAVSESIDLTNATIKREGGMTVSGSNGGCGFTYGAGAQIGASLSKSINLTNIESIMYDVSITGFYNGTYYPTADRFGFLISVSNSAVNYDIYNTQPQKVNIYEKTGAYINQRIDVSGLTGSFYLNFLGNGVTAIVTNLKACSNDGKIMYLDNKYLST